MSSRFEWSALRISEGNAGGALHERHVELEVQVAGVTGLGGQHGGALQEQRGELKVRVVGPESRGLIDGRELLIAAVCPGGRAGLSLRLCLVWPASLLCARWAHIVLRATSCHMGSGRVATM